MEKVQATALAESKECGCNDWFMHTEEAKCTFHYAAFQFNKELKNLGREIFKALPSFIKNIFA